MPHLGGWPEKIQPFSMPRERLRGWILSRQSSYFKRTKSKSFKSYYSLALKALRVGFLTHSLTQSLPHSEAPCSLLCHRAKGPEHVWCSVLFTLGELTWRPDPCLPVPRFQLQTPANARNAFNPQPPEGSDLLLPLAPDELGRGSAAPPETRCLFRGRRTERRRTPLPGAPRGAGRAP